MYRQPSKRKLLVRRVISYALMTIAVVTLVLVLVFVMLGYRYNGNDGKIEQGGLVQFDSQPNGGTVTIDGRVFGTRTPSKSTLTSGPHTITVGQSGYQTWSKTVNVVPGAVLWLNYARLIPTHLSPESVATLKNVSDMATSPDNKTIALVEEAATPTIKLFDITGDTIKSTSVTVPADAYTAPEAGKTQSFTIEGWDSSSRYVLSRHDFGGSRPEWLVIDTQDASATKNITKLLDINASKVVFSSNDSNTLYAQIGTDVRKINLSAATLSRPLASDVAEFSIFDQSTIVFSTVYDTTTKTRSVGYYRDGADTSYVIRSYQDDGTPPLHVALGRYFGAMYEAIAYGNTVTVLKGDLPTTSQEASKLKQVATMPIDGGAQYLSIRTNGRFVVAQNGGTYNVYDLELKKATSTTLKGSSPVTTELQWIDDYMPWSDRDGTLRLYEFDGANQHDIMKIAPGFSVTLSPSEKYLYDIQKDGDSYHLERVKLLIS